MRVELGKREKVEKSSDIQSIFYAGRGCQYEIRIEYKRGYLKVRVIQKLRKSTGRPEHEMDDT